MEMEIAGKWTAWAIALVFITGFAGCTVYHVNAQNNKTARFETCLKYNRTVGECASASGDVTGSISSDGQ